MDESKYETHYHLSTEKMNNIDFTKFCEYGDEYFAPINQSDDKDVTFVLGCQNVQFRTNLIYPIKTTAQISYVKQSVGRTASTGSTNGTSKPNRLKNDQKKRLKKELTAILSDSKKLMFAIQLMKFAECAELSCKNNTEKYEILSITRPKESSGDDMSGTILEMMVQKTKLAQITIHKAIVKIPKTDIEMMEVSEDSLKFLTHIKIDNLETHAAITIYFALKTLSLIFGNLSLFSSELAVEQPNFNCSALLPRKYLADEKKMDYTKKYISQLFNFIFKKTLGGNDKKEDGNDTDKKLNDLINRLLMLGVTPCTIETMNKVLKPEGKEAWGSTKAPVVSVNSVQAILDVSTEHEIYETVVDEARCQVIRQQTQQSLKHLTRQASQTPADILPDYIFKRESIFEKIRSILKNNNICIVRGPAGVGKSIVARGFAQECINANIQVHEINAADDKIEASMNNFAAGMGIDVLDHNGNQISVDQIFQTICTKIRQRGQIDRHLLVFEDAQGKFLSRYYEYVKTLKTLVITKKKVHELQEFDEKVLVQIDSFTKKEGVATIKAFFKHYNLKITDETLFEKLYEGLGGFPLALFLVLLKFKFQSKSVNKETIDDIVSKGVEFGVESENNYRANKTQETDDPHLRKMTLIIKRLFECIKENEEKDDPSQENANPDGKGVSPSERLFAMLSFMDIDYLYQEMFKTINNDAKSKQYEKSLERLKDMGLIHYEKREYSNYPLNRKLRSRCNISGFKNKIVVHPLAFKAFRSYTETTRTDEDLKDIFEECCNLIQHAHDSKDDTGKGFEKKNEFKRNVENNTNYKNLLGKDPNVKSLVKTIPPRILLGECQIRRTHSMQMLNTMDTKYLFNFAPNVSRLESFECPPNFTDDDLMKLVPYFHHLKVLKFFKCKRISDEGLNFLAQNWPENKPKLKELILYECDRITDDGTAKLLASCKDIKILFLSGICLSSSFLNFVASTCDNVRKMILGVAGNLWEKNLNKIQNVTDDGILAISKACKKLKNLNLNHCDKITDQALKHLAENATELKSLEIFGCTNISIEGVINEIQLSLDNQIASSKSSTWKEIKFNTCETKVRSDRWKEFEKLNANNRNKPRMLCPKEPKRNVNTPWTAPLLHQQMFASYA